MQTADFISVRPSTPACNQKFVAEDGFSSFDFGINF